LTRMPPEFRRGPRYRGSSGIGAGRIGLDENSCAQMPYTH